MADEAPIRFGIVGCAEIARKLARAITLASSCTVHAIASRSIEKAEQFAGKTNLAETAVKVYGSYDELLDDPDVDAVYMPLPTSLHLKWAVLAAEKKKHLLLEKPTALDVVELDKILKACEDNGVQFMDASMWYHHPRTAKMKELLSDPHIFGQIKVIHTSASFLAGPEFLENDIRVKPDLDALGALGDVGWYCVGSILWAMDLKLPTTVTAVPKVARNPAGVIMSCSATLNWEEETLATFYCSFLADYTQDITVCASKGTLRVQDFVLPYEGTTAAFSFTTGAKFVDLHIGWNVKPQEVQVINEPPQEVLMVEEFARLVKNIKSSNCKPESKWPQKSRMTQLVLDAVKQSIDLGFKPVHL
ncbi:OLC1v1010286C1 [Oldenlandia corymbosa var. corymbosa]|uniref:OLC1v1010286C1 n=1 Tax=Oldenlandia corymbosa var. corymbosa TaxID=529605 RepID=A0AAV1DQY5_OLDCO|nr:OLC1v1010286C1 [Oldenlandia corymbosa var. corymbosa]